MIRQAVASNGRAAVLIGEWGHPRPELVLLRYAPKAIGSPDRRAEFDALCERAASKLGWVRDKRAQGGWCKVDEGVRP